jgi:hypothetical protein
MSTERDRLHNLFPSEIADFQEMNEIRARVDETVTEEDTAEALKPWYRQFCRRPTFNDEYLATFALPSLGFAVRGLSSVSTAGCSFQMIIIIICPPRY